MSNLDERISHAQFTLPKPQVHASHPFKDQRNHDSLMEYLKQRLQQDKSSRDSRIARYAQIDRDVAAWIKLDEQDRERKAKHERDGSPQPTAISLPLTWVHIDDMMTYYAQTFAPNRGMFYHTAGKDMTETATQLVALMNNHAIYGSYYRHLLRSIFNILKYNIGGLGATWAVDYGPKIIAQPDGSASLGSQRIFAGNKIHAFDMYNLFYDASVEPNMLHKDGEWFAHAEMKSHYWLKNKCMEETFFNCESILDADNTQFQCSYYRDPPLESKITDAYSDTSSGGALNWFAFMSGSDNTLVNNAFELVTMHIRINPNDFGLIQGNKATKDQRNRYEIWRFTMLNGEKIIGADYMPNIHNHLPAYFGLLNDDGMREAAKSSAEILNPLQQFSSFLLNAHVKANRKNLFGTTYYDPSRLNMSAVPKGEVAAEVPILPQGYGQDIRTMIYRDSQILDTKQTLQDLQSMLGIIDQFFPTQSLPSQIAGIDRAIDSQVAAVQQGSNRRQHKGARLIDDTMMRPLRFCLYYNIVQFQEDGQDISDFFSGASTKINLQNLRDSSIIDLIGQGLKAIDRQQVAGLLQQIIFALIQAPAAAQGIDLLSLLDFWTSMLDIDTNMKQFALTPEQQMAAGAEQPVDQSGNPISPANDPARLTSPLYG